GSAARPPPPVAAALASSLRVPSRGDPPHDGRFAQHEPPALANGSAFSRVQLQKRSRRVVCSGKAYGHHRVATAASTYAGGRRGKERAASLRAQQRLAAGGRRPGRRVPRTVL